MRKNVKKKKKNVSFQTLHSQVFHYIRFRPRIFISVHPYFYSGIGHKFAVQMLRNSPRKEEQCMEAHLESVRGAFTLVVRCGFTNTTCGMLHLFVWLWHTHTFANSIKCMSASQEEKPLSRGTSQQINDKYWITCYHRLTHENNGFRLSRMRPWEGGVEALISLDGNSQSLIWLMYKTTERLQYFNCKNAH